MNKIISKSKLPIDSFKETSWLAILLFYVLYCIAATLINLVVFKSNILDPIYSLTYGLINQTLIVNIVDIIIFIVIIILKSGKLTFFDIGVKKNRLLSAVVAIVTLWVFMQVLNIIIELIIDGKPIFNNEWYKYGVTGMFGEFIAQLFGNCLFEEIAFRGFLLVQICKKLRNTKWNLFIGVVVSQLLFAIMHIPNRIYSGMDIFEILPSIIIVFIIGLLFASVYLVTDNLFLVIGIHTLLNTPLLVFNGLMSIWVIAISTIIILIIWDRTFGKLNKDAHSTYELNKYANG